MLIRSRAVLSFILVFLFMQTFALAEDGAHGGDNKPQATNINEPGEAVKAPRATERYSEKGQTLNPVAIDIAPNGDIYIAEGWRPRAGVLDNRWEELQSTDGVINDLKKKTVEDRLEQINMLLEKKKFPPDYFTNTADKVRLLRDTTGDGRADQSTVYADGFNDPLDGIASGVLYHEGKVYATIIPHLWLLEDKDGDGDADETTEGERVSLSYGWGIRWGFYGHDMHGLIKGPDGRIYFSIGDRGYNVTTKEGKQLYGPDRGAVFRMWPDGSGLELYFEGLRNPQELAFDNYGNLFTGDNNSDSGDKARFAYLPEGGDAGWRQDVQSLNDRGPWNREHMWEPRDVEQFGLLQPAWIIPPIKNVGRGPSGIAHYPGTGDAFPSNGSFLMCDYPAGVRHIHAKPDGAFFRVIEDSQLPTEGETITDVAWGYDGKLYLTDWGGGWRPNPNGYIKAMKNEAAQQAQAEQIAEVKQLFADGFEKLSDEKLIELLGHADQRVRIHAQWELASDLTEDTRLDLMISIATNSEWSELQKIHALWCLAMDARNRAAGKKGPIQSPSDVINSFGSQIAIDIVRDGTGTQLRAQALSVLGDLGYYDDTTIFIDVLFESKPILKYHAAIALGKGGNISSIVPLLDLLDRNNNKDVAIRHAASYGLSLIGDAEAIAAEAKSKGAAARLGAMLALRRLDSPLLAQFLNDEDPQVVAEAARAIYDKRVMDAIPALAASLDTLPQEMMNEPTMRRAIEANIRLADEDSAMRLGRLAANDEAPEQWRLLAMQELDGWAKERNREGVWGAWWPRPEQTMGHSNAAMKAYLPSITRDKNIQIATQARILELRHIKQAAPVELAEITLDVNEPGSLRLGTLQMLINADTDLATDTVKRLVASADESPAIRIQARQELIRLDLEASQLSYVDAIESGTLLEQQDAIAKLGGDLRARAAVPGSTFVKLTDALKRGELDPALMLDVIETVTNNQAMPAPARLTVQQYVEQNQVPAEAPFLREASLYGGSVERGRDIFLNHEAAQCQRCHAKDGSDTVGPGLNGIAVVYDANYLYDALVRPGTAIANGFANTTVQLSNGQTASGRILPDQSDDQFIVLTNADGVITRIPRDQVQGEPVISDQSLMPTMTDKLSPMELRDVLAYLGSLNSNPSPTYRVANSGGSKASGPQLVKSASDWNHAILLPATLLIIAGSLVALLILTMLGAKAPRPS